MENLAFFTRSLKKSKLRFTLVELIIVITILAILRTIGFMSFSSYVSDARDTNRVVTIKSIQSGIDMYSSMKSSLPTPDNALTLSGGTGVYIKQGIIGKSVSSTIKLTNDVKDPKTNKEYVYSISGNGNYYQIGADLENAISYNSFANTAYAEQTKAYVKGNYSFDPSLPSLITITGSVNTNSGIFDPNVCFVIDGGTNLVTSSSGTCTSKYKMNLKDYDSSLVGYWDMESITGGLLKDLSGNGNNGTFSGSILPSSTGGYLGKGLFFSGGYINLGETYTGSTFDFSGKINISITSIIKYNNIFDIGRGNTIISSTDGNGFSQRVGSGFLYSDFRIEGNTLPIIPKEDFISQNNLYYSLTSTYDGNKVKGYINGKFIGDKNILGFLTNRPNGCIFLGADPRGCGDGLIYFLGIIDDIKIYNRALSDSEIAQQAKIAGF